MASEGTTKNGCILFFVKSPEQAPVKSRLAEAIGEETARRLYRNFVLDMLDTLSDITAKGRSDVNVCFYPPDAGAARTIRNWLGDDYLYTPQQGADLGERMKNAFLASFAGGYRRTVILGSDTPDLTGGIITEAFHRLEQGGAVIGPAYDGGYYLIGFQSGAFLPAVFEGIPWDSGDVFTGTMETFRQCKSDISVLPFWRDIDTLTDLQDLRERHRNGSFARSRTMRYLRSRDGKK